MNVLLECFFSGGTNDNIVCPWGSISQGGKNIWVQVVENQSTTLGRSPTKCYYQIVVDR